MVTTHRPDTASSDRIRQIAMLVSVVLAVVGAAVGSGAFAGTPIAEAADGALAADATLVAPGGPAFGIWSVIYLGLIALAVWQVLPAQAADPRQRRLGWWISASMLLNAAWILSVQAGLLTVSVVVIIALLVTLALIFRVGLRYPAQSWIEAVVVDGTMGLYLGWVSVATVANIAAALKAAGVGGLGLGETAWGIIVLVVAGAIGIALAVAGRGRLAVAAALAWGLAWIAFARLDGPLLSTPVAATAIAAAVATVGAAVILRLRSVRAE